MKERTIRLFSVGTLLWFALHGVALAQEEPARSPWLAVPLVSSDPKVGTSFGGMAGYLHSFDDASPVSLFALTAKYSNTDSFTAGLFTQTYFGSDRHRVSGGIATGKIRNDYDDFLGSGLPAQTTDDLRFGGARYLYRIADGWYGGVQAVATNYVIQSEDAAIEGDLEILGLTGFDSNGIGLVFTFDNRDNTRSPTHGRQVAINNLAYREALGGDASFDVYQFKYREYLPHGQGHVLAYRAQARFTDDAPESAYSSIALRGYTRGNYLAPNSMLVEAEERYRIHPRWSLAGFAGAACLFDGMSDCGESDSWYPEAGLGVIFDLKPAAGMVVRLNYAKGEEDNSGLYLAFGQAF